MDLKAIDTRVRSGLKLYDNWVLRKWVLEILLAK